MRFLLLIPVFVLFLSNVPFIQEMPMEKMMAMAEDQQKRDCCKDAAPDGLSSCDGELQSRQSSCHQQAESNTASLDQQSGSSSTSCRKPAASKPCTSNQQQQSTSNSTSCHQQPQPKSSSCHRHSELPIASQPQSKSKSMACHSGTVPVDGACQPSGANCVCICVFQFAGSTQDLKIFQFIPVNISAGRTGYLQVKWKDPHIASPGQPPDWI